ncbi:hypothetical protein CALVIDRAFT_555012 [Calocera viscosa TUFC12733]|uniref:Malate dehydrogenase n=1 Tax=Calocera viscosa (strain TUFC12733) TaxID=1330018 RepID=A0A167MEB8_CALVF|nr:hypothetical protein CALVIDRAFT_555012 [Calocera viscosa TUFC12733]
MHFLLKLAALAFAALPAVSAAAVPRALSGQGTQPHCNISASHLTTDVPANLSSLIPPSSVSLIQVTVGFGTQNYTCTNGKYVSAGAVAQLFDISCVQNVPAISCELTQAIHQLEQQASGETFLNLVAAKLGGGYKLADHYFDTSIGTLSPVFNFQVSHGGFVIGKKLVDVPAPVNPAVNVDWLQLQGVSGNAAKYVIREETAGGQPPSSCSVANATLEVAYAAKYWFFA